MSDSMSTMPLIEKNRESSSENIPSINYTKGDVESQQLNKVLNYENPIQRYNQVINEYNNQINQVDGITLQKLKDSFLVGWFNKIFSQPTSRWIIAIFFLLASGLNVLLFLLFLVTFFIYLSNYSIHSKNESKVPDPFLKMIYCEEMCEQLNVSWYYFKLNVEEMNNFSFNFDTMKYIKDRIKDSIVEFMVYDIRFYENYTSFLKVKGRFIRWMFVALLLIGINAAVVVLLYDIIIDKNL
ncbi:hypothetical protein ABPG74_001360 [Tetrahymena malaccensis]